MAENEQPVKPKSKKMLFIILGVVLVLAIGGGAAYYFLVMKADSHAAESKPKTPELQVFVPLEAFTVNLRPEGAEPQQYLQTTLNLQVPSEEMSANLKAHMPELRSRILFILTNKKAAEITSVEGKNTLITEITEQIQKPFSGSESEQKITGVYLTSFIIQ